MVRKTGSCRRYPSRRPANRAASRRVISGHFRYRGSDKFKSGLDRDFGVRRALILAVGLACIAGLTVLLLQFSRCPLRVNVETVDSSLMVDRSLILTLGVANPLNGSIHLQSESLHVEAKVAERWIAVTNLWMGASWVNPEGKSILVALVPSETQACRLTLNYSPETPKERLAKLLTKRAPKLVANFPALSRWLWPGPPGLGWVPPQRHWTEADFEVRLPDRPLPALGARTF